MEYKNKLTPALATKMSRQQTDKHFEVTDTVIAAFKLKRYMSCTMTFSLMYTAPDGRRLRSLDLNASKPEGSRKRNHITPLFKGLPWPVDNLRYCVIGLRRGTLYPAELRGLQRVKSISVGQL